METSYNYTCPHCSQECSVGEALTGQDVMCPNCSQEFFATPPEDNSQVILPEKLPFFKSGRRKLLESRMQELVLDGELSKNDADVLNKTAILMGLNESDMAQIARESFFKELAPIRQRIEHTFLFTDEDLEEIEVLKRKYGVADVCMQGDASLCRQIYLLESKGQLPPPMQVSLMLDANEHALFCIASTWDQTRVQDGIDVITELSSGTLYVTTKRLMFHGDTRSTKVEYKKIIDLHVHSGCFRVEKATGKPDYFTMKTAEARYVTSLIRALREP